MSRYQAISIFSEIVLVPHVPAEVSSLARQIRNPAHAAIQARLKTLIETTVELAALSADAVQREEYLDLGLIDAVILHLCALDRIGAAISLLTSDERLAVQAEMLGYTVLNFLHLRG